MFRKFRSKRFSPSRRLSGEEIWDRRYGFEGESFRSHHNDRGKYSPRYRRFSHENRRSGSRSFFHQDRSPPRSDRQEKHDGKHLYRDEHTGEFSRPFFEHPQQNLWTRPPDFDPSIPPPFFSENQFREGCILMCNFPV